MFSTIQHKCDRLPTGHAMYYNEKHETWFIADVSESKAKQETAPVARNEEIKSP